MHNPITFRFLWRKQIAVLSVPVKLTSENKDIFYKANYTSVYEQKHYILKKQKISIRKFFHELLFYMLNEIQLTFYLIFLQRIAKQCLPGR